MVDIIREVAADAGFKVEVEGIPFATLIPSLTGSKIDIIAAAMYITPPRQEVVDFSRPIYTYGEGLVVPKKDTREYAKLEDMKGFTVGAQKGTAYVEPLQNPACLPKSKSTTTSQRFFPTLTQAAFRPASPTSRSLPTTCSKVCSLKLAW